MTVDERLAANASRGDRDAFADLYQRHYQGINDFAARMVQDSDAAADVVQGTFVSAWENLQKRTVTGNVRAWLYTIARNNAINHLRRTQRVLPAGVERMEREAAGRAFAVPGGERASDPHTALQDKEIAELVWTSAAALRPNEYSLLDLHLRRGLTADELAAALGVRKGNVYTMLSRLRDSLEESVTSALLVRRGRRDCPDLDSILSAAGPADDLTADVRRAIQRHLKECRRCQENKRRFVSPAEIFSGLALVPVPAGLQAADLHAVWERIEAGPGPAGALQNALHSWSGLSVPLKAATVAAPLAALAAAIVTPIALLSGGSDSPSQVVAGEVAAPSGANLPGLELVEVEVAAPERALAGEQFDLFARTDLITHGLAGDVLADTTLTLEASPGCDAEPAAPVVLQDTQLPAETPVSVSRGWRVTCAEGEHTFTVTADAALDPSREATDDDPGDNSATATATTDVRAP